MGSFASLESQEEAGAELWSRFVCNIWVKIEVGLIRIRGVAGLYGHGRRVEMEVMKTRSGDGRFRGDGHKGKVG